MIEMYINEASTINYGFYVKHKVITPGEARTKYVDVPGATYPIDLTTYLTGAVCYEPDELDVELVSVDDHSTAITNIQNMISNFHGKKCRVKFSDITTLRYIRLNISVEQDKSTYKMKITGTYTS